MNRCPYSQLCSEILTSECDNAYAKCVHYEIYLEIEKRYIEGSKSKSLDERIKVLDALSDNGERER